MSSLLNVQFTWRPVMNQTGLSETRKIDLVCEGWRYDTMKVNGHLIEFIENWKIHLSWGFKNSVNHFHNVNVMREMGLDRY